MTAHQLRTLARSLGLLAALVTLSACVIAVPQRDDQGGNWPRRDDDRDDGRGDLVTCESEDGRRRNCPVSGGLTRVDLDQQLSKSACVYGSSWGYSRHEIWVDDGCRARFRIRTGGGGGGWLGGGGGNGGGNHQGGGPSLITCESNDDRFVRCELSGWISRVDLEKQLSKTKCIYGKTWGTDRGGIWVSGGCRARFRATAR